MVLDTAGNLGLGTDAPDGALHLASTTSSVQRLIFSNSNVNINPQQRIEFWESTGTGTAANANCAIEYDGTGTYQSSDGTLLIKGYGSSADLPIAGFNRNGNVYLGMSGIARVGIGTVTPSKPLDVVGYVKSSIGFKAANYTTMLESDNESVFGNTAYYGVLFKTNNATRMKITNAGNVGIGTETPNHKLEVNGSFAATTKSFLIDHPTKENMRLQYGALEGPENGVYVRGKSNYKIIELPEYWTHLVDEESITVQLTCIGHLQHLYVEKIRNNQVFINTDKLREKLNYYYIIHAERKDVDKLEVEIEK